MMKVTGLGVFVVILVLVLTVVAGIIGLVLFLLLRKKTPASPIIPEVQDDDVVKCSNCGNLCYANQPFCQKCGNKPFN